MYTATTPEIHCVAQAVYAEARGESFDGKRAVAHVINNRSKKRGIGYCKVIRQAGQFKFRTGVGKQWEDSLRAARNLGSDLTAGAMYFKAHYSKQRWKYKMTIRIGGHSFYK